MFDWNRSCSYDQQQKRRFHTTARSRLKKLAVELGLSSGNYDLRSNKAGIAVSGEITLHHDRAYIQVGQFGLSSGHGILIRTCKGRKDYTGGPNHFLALGMLDDIPALAAAVRAITGIGRVVSRSLTTRRLSPGNPNIAVARPGRPGRPGDIHNTSTQ